MTLSHEGLFALHHYVVVYTARDSILQNDERCIGYLQYNLGSDCLEGSRQCPSLIVSTLEAYLR